MVYDLLKNKVITDFISVLTFKSKPIYENNNISSSIFY